MSAVLGWSWRGIVTVGAAVAVAVVPTLVTQSPAGAAGPASAVSHGSRVAATDGFARSVAGGDSFHIARATDFGAVDPASGWGTIAGVVLDSDGKPLPEGSWGHLTVRDSGGATVPLFTSSNGVGQDYLPLGAGGSFGVTGLGAGDYQVSFRRETNWVPGSSDDGDGWSTETASTSAPVRVAAGQLINTLTLKMANSKINGKVTARGGGALPAGEDVSVSVVDTAGRESGNGEVRRDGTFSISGLGAGDHKLKFTTEYGEVWWRGGTSAETATAIRLTPGGTVGGINQDVPGPATISGVVHGPHGGPLPEGFTGEVVLHSGEALNDGDSPADRLDSAEFGADGKYALTGIRPGDYRLEFRNRGWEDLGTTWWSHGLGAAAATVVHVGADTRLDNVSPSLMAYGTITGTLLGADGKAVVSGGDICVESVTKYVAYSQPHPIIDACGGGEFPDGRYSLTVPPGDYKVSFTQPGLSQVWVGGTSRVTAATVHVAEGGTTQANVDGRGAAKAASISGVVHGPSGAPLPQTGNGGVEIYRSDGTYVNWRLFTSDGKFSLGNLAPGDYKLQAEFDGNHDLLPVWWRDGVNGPAATVIHVNAGQDVVGINPELVGEGTVSGTVQGPGGAPLDQDVDGSVSVAPVGGGREGWASFDSSGTFSVADLTPGDYKVKLDVYDGDYDGTWWKDATSEQTATIVHIGSGAKVELNPRLARTRFGVITGRVSAAAGSKLPAGCESGGCEVEAFEKGVSWGETSDIHADGTFRIERLRRTGDYEVRFQVPGFVEQWWRGSATRSGATPVHVELGQTVTGLNPTLSPAGSIAGKVTGPRGAALTKDAGGAVLVFDATGTLVRSDQFDASGEYSLPDLAPGSYKVRVFSDDYRYRSQWLGGAASAAASTPVVVKPGTVATVVNPALGLTSAASGSGAPAAPTGATATAGDARASVSWKATTSDGGSPLSGYTVTASPGGRTCVAAPSVLSCVVSGLTNGQAYTFTVTAVNRLGLRSAPSTATAPVTPRIQVPPAKPSAVRAAKVTYAAGGVAALSWSPPTNPGQPAAVTYRVRITGRNTNVFGAEVATTKPSMLYRRLNRGATYKVQIVAVNATGRGPAVTVVIRPTR